MTFQRTPNYVYTHLAPGSLLGNDNDLRQNPPYTTEEREKFVNNPDFHRDYRRKIIHNINSSFKIVSFLISYATFECLALLIQ